MAETPETTPEVLEELTRLLAEADPAPWRVETKKAHATVMTARGAYVGETRVMRIRYGPINDNAVRMEPVPRRAADLALWVAARNALPALLRDLAAARAERDEARDSNPGWNGAHEALKADFANMEHRALAAERERDALRAEVSRLREVHNETHAALARAGAAIHDLANKGHPYAVDALTAEVSRLREDRDDYAATLRDVASERAELQAEVSRLRSEVERGREALRDAAFSLMWIGARRSNGHEELSDVLSEIRQYARSRADVARALSAREGKGEDRG